MLLFRLFQFDILYDIKIIILHFRLFVNFHIVILYVGGYNNYIEILQFV